MVTKIRNGRLLKHGSRYLISCLISKCFMTNQFSIVLINGNFLSKMDSCVMFRSRDNKKKNYSTYWIVSMDKQSLCRSRQTRVSRTT